MLGGDQCLWDRSNSPHGTVTFNHFLDNGASPQKHCGNDVQTKANDLQEIYSVVPFLSFFTHWCFWNTWNTLIFSSYKNPNEVSHSCRKVGPTAWGSPFWSSSSSRCRLWGTSWSSRSSRRTSPSSSRRPLRSSGRTSRRSTATLCHPRGTWRGKGPVSVAIIELNGVHCYVGLLEVNHHRLYMIYVIFYSSAYRSLRLKTNRHRASFNSMSIYIYTHTSSQHTHIYIYIYIYIPLYGLICISTWWVIMPLHPIKYILRSTHQN